MKKNQEDIFQLNEPDFVNLLKHITDAEIIKNLSKMGRLGENYSGTKNLLRLLKNKNKNIRILVVTNLAKLSDESLLKIFKKQLYDEKISKIRRELTSAIGRIRSKKCIPCLKELLKDKDPNIILQAIRGLLVFKDHKDINQSLMKLKNHKNELVRNVINIELYEEKNTVKSKHHLSPDYLKNTVVLGDVSKILKNVGSDSVHLTFTSPPYYNARDYSIYNSYEGYISFLESVFKEVYKITKEGRFFILNTSPIIIPRVGRKYSSTRYPIPYDIHHFLIKMGWEFIDDIIWVKPEPSAKNRISGFNQHRQPVTYKPNCVSESVMVYRKKSTKLLDWILKQYSKEIINESKVGDGFPTSNIWNISPTFDKSHSAVFPKELCDNVIKLYSFVGDLIFDPFAGSGTVGVSAIKNNRYFFMTEIQKKYFDDMKSNLKNDLFTDSIPKFLTLKKFNTSIKSNENFRPRNKTNSKKTS